MRLLSNLLKKFIKKGSLRFYDADGQLHVFGGQQPGPAATVRLHDRALEKKLFTNPELYAAEAYMDGKLTFEKGSGMHDFLMLFSVNRQALYTYGSQKVMRKVWRALRRWHQANRSARRPKMRAIITTSRANSTGSSSTRTCNIPAPISAIPNTKRWNRRSATSSFTPPPSCN